MLPSLREGLATVAWNAIARELVTRSAPGQRAALRLFAYLTLAQLDAILALGAAGDAAQRGAVAGASAEVLAYVFPAEAQFVATQVATARTAGRGGHAHAFAVGEAVGRGAGQHVVARARGDRFDETWTGPVPEGAQHWRSGRRPPQPPLLPALGRMSTFFLERLNAGSRADSRSSPMPP